VLKRGYKLNDRVIRAAQVGAVINAESGTADDAKTANSNPK
jgi:hypothetical protein